MERQHITREGTSTRVLTFREREREAVVELFWWAATSPGPRRYRIYGDMLPLFDALLERFSADDDEHCDDDALVPLASSSGARSAFAEIAGLLQEIRAARTAAARVFEGRDGRR